MRSFGLLLGWVVLCLASAGCGGIDDEAATTSAAAEGHWVVVDIGDLNDPDVVAVDINNKGQVAGRMDTGNRGAGGTATIGRAFLWSEGEIRDLGALGGEGSGANALSDRGQVVGWAETDTGDGHGFLWEDGEMRDLGLLSGRESVAVDINEAGQIVGTADTSAFDGLGNAIEHAVLWENGTIRDLGTLGGRKSYAQAINDKGQVVGWSTTETGATHVFLWERGKMSDLGALGGFLPEDINAYGQMVGGALKGSDIQVFVWEDGRMTKLESLGGRESSAWATNDQGQVVGQSDTKTHTNGESTYHACLWEEGRVLDLGTLGERKSQAVAINERGQILGTVGEPFVDQRPVIWTLEHD